MAKIKIIYGTAGGNTEIVCERVAEIAVDEGHEVLLVRAKTAEVSDFEGADLLILAGPTYGHGLLETYLDKLIQTAKKSDLRLDEQKAVVIGLGSPIYDVDYFIESEKILSKFLLEKGANIVADPLLIGKSPIPFLKNIIPEWTVNVINKI